MNKPPAQTILRWLRDNEIRLGALTHHDSRALLAAVQIAAAWVAGDFGNRVHSALAFRSMVLQMQPHTRFMAFHAIAHVADWCHRWELWLQAELPAEDLKGVPECKFGPQPKAATTAEAA